MTKNNCVKKFRSVQIIHDILHRIDFSYLAELFRFMGILVCEKILVDGEESESEKRTRYSARLYTGKRTIVPEEEEMLQRSKEKYKQYLELLTGEVIFLDEFSMLSAARKAAKDVFSEAIPCLFEKDDQKELLTNIIDRVLQNIFDPLDFEAISVIQLKEVIDIYVEQELWLHSMNMQYFVKYPSPIMVSAREAFLESHARLEAVLKQKERENVDFLYRYALLWCEMKVNNACSYNRERLHFPIETVSAKCRRLCDDYPDFVNARVLLGLIYEPSSGNANEALWAFSDALQGLKGECFAAPVYYWVGKQYDSYRSMKKMAEMCYQYADQSKAKFRTYFKLAIIERDRENYEKAIYYFDKIIRKLTLKLKMKFVDPLEVEYLFKAYTQETYINHKMRKYWEAIEVGEKAEGIKAGIDNNYYFEVFYGKGKADEYRKILKERLKSRMVLRLLADSYERIYDNENASRYRSEAMKLEETKKAIHA